MDGMTPTLLAVAAFVLLLALVPAALKWTQARVGGGIRGTDVAIRLVSAVAVGPQQRVVTVEVGPPNARTTLVLGVTQQAVTCLHSFPASAAGVSVACTGANAGIVGS